MRLLRVLMVLVAGLIVCVIAVDSYGARVPIRDIRIPIYLGDPDNVDCSRPRTLVDVRVALFGDLRSWGRLPTVVGIEKNSVLAERRVVGRQNVPCSVRWERNKR